MLTFLQDLQRHPTPGVRDGYRRGGIGRKEGGREGGGGGGGRLGGRRGGRKER